MFFDLRSFCKKISTFIIFRNAEKNFDAWDDEQASSMMKSSVLKFFTLLHIKGRC